MQRQHSKTSRRGLLKATLSFGILLGTGALAHAANNPFTPGSEWGGSYVSSVGSNAGSLTLNVTPNPATGVLIVGSANSMAVTQITWNPTGWVNIDGVNQYAGLHIQGQVSSTAGGTFAFSGTYQFQSVPGLPDDSGQVSLLDFQFQGLVSISLEDANIPSISIFPPDFLGTFESRSGFRGQVSFHRNAAPAPSRDGRTRSKITGVLRFNDMAFHFAMTFAPTPNADGSFNFDLIGGSGRGSVPIPFTVVSGRFFPGDRTGGLGTLQGMYQLIGTRGNTLDLGKLSLLQVP